MDDSRDPSNSFCGETVRRAIDIVGGKWTMLILWELLQEPRRYADLQRRVDGISQKVLSGDLRKLVQEGLVAREVKPTVPPQVTYSITPQGKSLNYVFAALDRWGHEHDAT
ncbi:transcriptional regulator [Brachybacterium endophyticum]|uniref:Transcriptional regulator n=1 Tax=Brachybacterium endophyticum TaxID=2182385 RepID=A0A2U2RGF0_9MICO|nr:helix-turn-helix domain-containing protein [Brachybacterium endophyticum]PWH04936.1 transcriptional regulator [Brachybacterium endophyticum]